MVGVVCTITELMPQSAGRSSDNVNETLQQVKLNPELLKENHTSAFFITRTTTLNAFTLRTKAEIGKDDGFIEADIKSAAILRFTMSHWERRMISAWLMRVIPSAYPQHKIS